MTRPKDDPQRPPWVAFIGLKFEYVAARPDDGYVHLGAGRPFRRLALCDKRARPPLVGGRGRLPPTSASRLRGQSNCGRQPIARSRSVTQRRPRVFGRWRTTCKDEMTD
jgi:hypothetical protein